MTFDQILKKLQGELLGGVLSGKQALPVEYPWVDHPQAGTRLEELPPESKGSPTGMIWAAEEMARVLGLSDRVFQKLLRI